MLSQLRPALVSFAVLTLITGVLYPAVVTGVAKVVFPGNAGGSVITRDGKAVGSDLVAQPFTDAKYFWPRPSAANYDGAAGAGSNLGPNNPALAEAVAARVQNVRNSALFPADLVTASSSGLDPHISPNTAAYQVARVAKARGMTEEAVRNAVSACTEDRTFGILGEPRVNVLRLNLLLDAGPTTAPIATSHSVVGWRGRAFLPEVQ